MAIHSWAMKTLKKRPQPVYQWANYIWNNDTIVEVDFLFLTCSLKFYSTKFPKPFFFSNIILRG